MIFSALVFLILFWPTSAAAEDPTPSIAGELRYDPHGLVKLRAEGVKPGAAVLWRVYPRAGVQRATTRAELLEFAAPPGVYEIECLVIAQGPNGMDVKEVFGRVTIGPAKIEPPPPGSGTLDAVNALGRIQFGNAGCTATVVGPRRADGRWDVLTASHCVPGVGSRGTMKLKDGRTLGLKVVVHQTDPDLAWCVTDDVIENLSYAKLATADPPVGTKVWHMGYGVDKPGNREDGTIDGDRDSNGQLRMILSVSHGDSGGGIFRSDTNELVSTVCCTAGLAQRVRMWGASATAIAAARPAAVKLDGPAASPPADAKWVPVKMPVIVEASPPACCH